MHSIYRLTYCYQIINSFTLLTYFNENTYILTSLYNTLLFFIIGL